MNPIELCKCSMDQQPIVSRAALEGILGFHVRDPAVYQLAFVHRSAAKTCAEQRGFVTHTGYERLKFLGDAVLNLVCTRYLFNNHPDKEEGYLTKVRTKLVSGQTLCKLAKDLKLHEHILMCPKAMQNGWNCNERILEDCFESLIAAVYLDLGLVAAREFILATINRYIDFASLERDTNYKDILMRWAQAKELPLPVYKHADAQEDARHVFETRCYVDGRPMGYGRHRGKKQGEQLAACQALMCLGVLTPDCPFTVLE